jgi:small membrane protein
MIIRILLIAGLASTAWLVFLRRNRGPFHIVTVFALLIAGMLAVMFPDLTQSIANLVGVGRGSDLVTYIAIVAVMFVLVHYYTKFVEVQGQITQLTRELAILRAEAAAVPLAPAAPAVADDVPPADRASVS